MPEGRKLINESEFDAATRETLSAVYSRLVEDDVIERGSEWLRLVVADAVLAMVRAGQTDYEAIRRYAGGRPRKLYSESGRQLKAPGWQDRGLAVVGGSTRLFYEPRRNGALKT